MDFCCRRVIAWLMGIAAPGMTAALEAVAERWAEVVRARAEVRSQRPSIRPTTPEGVAWVSRARTGEPLWPRVTEWLSRKMSVAGADLSSCVDS